MPSDPARMSMRPLQGSVLRNRSGSELKPGNGHLSQLAAIREGSPIKALYHIRRMRGGSQSQLMRCSDGKYYVVKFLNNPQGKRTLVNEMLCGFLAVKLDLPAPSSEVIYVDQALIRHSEQMLIQLPTGNMPLQAGACFGSEHPGPGSVMFDTWPERRLGQISNLADFAGVLVFDIWTSNSDFRQVFFTRKNEESPYRVTMVDNGWCFRATEWAFKDKPRLAMYPLTYVYKTISSMDSFEPWLTNLESNMNPGTIAEALNTVPLEWYRGEERALEKLLVQLDERRPKVRHLIVSLVQGSPTLFPGWSDTHSPLHSSVACRSIAASAFE